MARMRFVAGAVLTSAAALSASVALGQPSQRDKPPIRTPAGPRTPPLAPAPPTTPGTPATPTPGTPTATPGTPGAPGVPKPDPNDPLTKVPQGAKEIDFKPKNPGDLVSFNLDDADLPDLVKAIGQVTGKRFIYGSKIKSLKATVYSPEKVSAAEAYNAFLAILQANGLTVIPHGQFLEITDSQASVKQNTPVFGTASPVPAEDRPITRLYRLSNGDAADVKGVLDNFKSKDGDILIYAPGNLLIITDTGENIHRLLRIVEEVDVGSAGDQIWVQPVLNGSATDTAAKLNEILGMKSGGAGAAGAGGKGAAGASVIPDERTNSLIITSNKGDYEKLLELLKRIDVPMSGDAGLHIMRLQYQDCGSLQQTLSGLIGGGNGSTGTRPGGTGTNRPTQTNTPTQGGTQGGGARPAGGGTVQGSNTDIFEGNVKVTCDPSTNSLLTTASQHDYAHLRELIYKLDQPLREVFFEAVIMDIADDHKTEWGIGYHAGAPINGVPSANDQSFIYGGENVGQSILGVPANLEALALGVRGPDIPNSQNLLGTGVSIPALGIVLHALASDGDTNVLATPHILATDNILATIQIGQDIPFQTNVPNLGSLTSAAGGAAAGLAGLLGGGLSGVGGQGNIVHIGTIIKVTPHVNDSDQVRLELDEEISDLGSRDGALGAATVNKRTATTTLIVRDQQTVVIGGLVRESEAIGETKIPVLGDIPILGFLFKQQQKQKHRSNLLLVLTPYIVRDQDDLRAIFERKMQERQEFLDRYFVFSDSNWEPPEDYSRKVGLVEAIRQSQLEADEKQRILEEAIPKKPKDHLPVEPIALPSIATPKSTAGTAPATSPTPNQPVPQTNPGRPNRPGSPGMPPNPGRVE